MVSLNIILLLCVSHTMYILCMSYYYMTNSVDNNNCSLTCVDRLYWITLFMIAVLIVLCTHIFQLIASVLKLISDTFTEHIDQTVKIATQLWSSYDLNFPLHTTRVLHDSVLLSSTQRWLYVTVIIVIALIIICLLEG